MLKKSLLLIALSLGLSTELVLTNLVAVAKPASRGASVTRTSTTKKTRRVNLSGFRVGVRASGNREGGAARGEGCKQTEDLKTITPPAPKEWDISKAPVEPTISDHPTFFVNLPTSSAKKVEFILMDEGGDILVQENIDVSSSKGLLAYRLPKSFKGLEVGKKYVSRFSLLCSEIDRSGNPKVSGLIQRVEPSAKVAEDLAAAKDDFERLAIYNDNGYWHETLQALVDLRAANPNDQDLITSWNNVFKSVSLSSLSEKPVVLLTGVPLNQ